MNDVDSILLVAKGTIFAGFLFVVMVKVGMYFRMIWTTEHAVFTQVFSADHPETLLENYFIIWIA